MLARKAMKGVVEALRAVLTVAEAMAEAVAETVVKQQRLRRTL